MLALTLICRIFFRQPWKHSGLGLGIFYSRVAACQTENLVDVHGSDRFYVHWQGFILGNRACWGSGGSVLSVCVCVFSFAFGCGCGLSLLSPWCVVCLGFSRACAEDFLVRVLHDRGYDEMFCLKKYIYIYIYIYIYVSRLCSPPLKYLFDPCHLSKQVYCFYPRERYRGIIK